MLKDYKIFRRTVECGEDEILSKYVNDEGLIATYFVKNKLVSDGVDGSVAILPVHVDLLPFPVNKGNAPDLEDSLCCSNSFPLSLEEPNDAGGRMDFETIKSKDDGDLSRMIVESSSSTLMKRSNDLSTWLTTGALLNSRNSLILAERWQDKTTMFMISSV